MASVLVVDDVQFMRAKLKDMLVQGGHEVQCEAENGKEAVSIYKDCKPDLVIMDVTMPEMNGIEALREIKVFDPSALVIMCSAMGQEKLVMEAVEAGAKDFIIKPFEDSRVLDAINHMIR
ncbi:response regulator [Bacillus marinisedimentorum]|uniref:response regulator n=1 Tax=Bacillus marinisedimentorum TaxID=1821260 RepID=UPI0007DFE927|nr:response regulator [Bacillus marinisedimentorum]